MDPTTLASILESSIDQQEFFTPLHIFQVGRCISENNSPYLAKAFNNLLSQITSDDTSCNSIIQKHFIEFNQAFIAVLSSNNIGFYNNEQICQAISSTSAIYCNSHACALAFDPQIIELLAQAYRKHHTCNDHIILASVANLIVHGLLLSEECHKHNDDEDELLSRVLEVLQSILCLEQNTCLGDILEYSESGISRNAYMPDSSIMNAVAQVISDTAQQEYIEQMLESSPRSDSLPEQDEAAITRLNQNDASLADMAASQNMTAAAESETNGLQALINQVQGIFPDLGEGYIEAALACYKGDASRTISALLEDDLHPQLRALDKKLGPRKKESADNYDASDDLEAVETQKKLVQRMQKEEENQAFMLDSIMEYNDDYDDQFDDFGDDSGAGGGAIGHSDSGMYADIDYDAIRKYNQVARSIEEDMSFWDNMRNTNRGVKPPADQSQVARTRPRRLEGGTIENDTSKNNKPPTKQTKGGNKSNSSNKKSDKSSTKETSSGDKGKAKAKSSSSNKKSDRSSTTETSSGGDKGKAKTGEAKAKASDATFTKSDKRRSEGRKRAQQKHNKARAMRKMG